MENVIKVKPYEHQVRATKFILDVFMHKRGGDVISQLRASQIGAALLAEM